MSIMRFKSISGFAFQQNIIRILNIYNRAPGITPPQFVPVHKEVCTGRTGFYVGMSAALTDKELEELECVLEDMEVT